MSHTLVRRGPRGRTGALGRLGALVLCGSLAAGAVLASAVAAGASSPSPTLELSPRHETGNPLVIEVVARLTEPARAGAKPASLAGVTISFSVHVQEFSGAPLLALGSATTDAEGEARFTYRPTWTGRQDLVASASSSTGDEIASATAGILATTATRPLAKSAGAVRPDGTIGQVVVGVLLAILVVLWIVLIAVVVRVHRGGVTPAVG